MSLTIASAFRLRNKLKERIKEITKACEWASASKPVGTEENTAALDGNSFADVIAYVSLLMSTLKNFNHAIEKANTVNKEDLITLETLKAEFAFYSSITNKIRSSPKYEFEYNPDGGKNKVELELVLDSKKIVTHYKELKKKISALEEKLANSNFAVKVDFDQEVINSLL